MADNYLEKKMDDYRRGVNAKAPRRSYINPAAPRCLTVEPQRIAAVISDDALLQALLPLLQGLPGVKVAFAGSDGRAGSHLAQSSGALFVPVTAHDESALAKVISETVKRWDGVDTLLTDIPPLVSTVTMTKVVMIDFTAAAGGAESQGNGHRNMTVINAPAGYRDMKAIAQAILLMLTTPAVAVSAVILR